jgi:hypothetical protein
MGYKVYYNNKLHLFESSFKKEDGKFIKIEGEIYGLGGDNWDLEFLVCRHLIRIYGDAIEIFEDDKDITGKIKENLLMCDEVDKL